MQDQNSSFYSQSNAISGPSYQQPLPPKAIPADTGDESQDGDNTKSSTKLTKKKAAKARPCQRCVKKGLGKECTEGLRKKAKYLMDDSEKSTLAGYSSNRRPVTIKRNASGKTLSSSNSPRIGDIRELPGATGHPLPGTSRLSNSFGAATAHGGESGTGKKSQSQDIAGSEPANVMQFYPTDMPADTAFGSEAANLEYAMLSSMFADSGTVTTPTLHPSSTDPPLFTMDPSWPEPAMMVPAGQASTAEQDRMMAYPFDVQSTVTTPGMASKQGGGGDLTGLSFTGSAGGAPVESPLTAMTPSDVYSLVVKPHDYTEGYHDLMKHLAKHFNQASILRVVRALAAFRPSLIALQMPLTFEDEVFLEKTFQRTLIELEKLISYNGTPTAVWRRTGEICLAGDEFCKLVDKSRTELVGRKKYIYHLFDNDSTCCYYEKFASYAFENTTQNFFMQVTLVVVEHDPQRTPTETIRKIPCAGSFTIRRDVFDLPSVIIGQLLPMNA
ncbi:hypothetical protein QFC21_001296 [Naganishia friedmannii]|uniref:Uncharacterized protein n=1 Tax=Naganishia friedmannii TaxID=89922 RepID=A0ACC2W3W2_9TREE|nr:hypothetical protein QFC21_001296 [Naganishia friedmannii]